ncbi:MAG: hypothetical protein NTU56_15565, partial [Proteobacteria bacterium]|nr:hypothetical protein [Pseudomonadota bacterium]
LDRALNKFGDSPMERFVGAALRAAGGVRPDADLSNIKVRRNGRTFTLDWRGAITGAAVDDMLRIPGKATTRSGAWRPPIPAHGDQCGAGVARAPLSTSADLSVRWRRQA